MKIKDNIHYDRSKSLSINAMVYFWLSGRGPGKSTQAKELVLEEYRKTKKTSFWIMRIDEIFKKRFFIDTFLSHFTEYNLVTTSTGVYETMNDEEGKVKLNAQNGKPLADYTKPVIYFASISTMVSKIRSIDQDAIKWIIIDEFIPNLKLPNQRYMKGEAEALMSVYNTLTRNNDFETKVILMGNPYQLNNPYFRFYGIDVREVRNHKDKIYVPFKKNAVIYNGKRFDLVVIDFFSVNPKLLAKIKATPYSALLSLNEQFYNTEMHGEEYFYKTPVIKTLDPYGLMYAKLVINHRKIYCYLDRSNYKLTGVGFHFDTIDNGSKSIEYIALDLDDIGGENIVVDRNNPLYIKLENIKRSIRVNAYSVSNENINDDVIDILTY